MRKMVESPIQVGNVATPSNETDRLSYLQRIYKLTYLVTRTQRRRVCVSAVVRGRENMVTSGQPTHEPSTYICVLKGIQEYILHMLYCRLISNSAAMALEESRSRCVWMHSIPTKSCVD